MKTLRKILDFLMFQSYLGSSMPTRPVPPIEETATILSDVVKYNDLVPEGHIGNAHLPDTIFDNEFFVYNCGKSKKHPNDFTVLIKPMKERK